MKVNKKYFLLIPHPLKHIMFGVEFCLCEAFLHDDKLFLDIDIVIESRYFHFTVAYLYEDSVYFIKVTSAQSTPCPATGFINESSAQRQLEFQINQSQSQKVSLDGVSWNLEYRFCFPILAYGVILDRPVEIPGKKHG